MFQAGDIALMVGAAMLGVAALLSSRLLRARRAAVVPTPPAEIAAEFRRRQSRCLRYGFAPLICGFATMVLGWGPTSGARTIAAMGLLAFVGGVFYLHTVYRCPGCEGTLTDDEGGLSLFPASCRRCGARFE